MDDKREYEVTISMTYNAGGPVDAALQLIDNMLMQPGWYAQVKDVESGQEWTVDTQYQHAEEQ